MGNILLYGRPARSAGFRGNLTYHAQDPRFSKRSIGGCWLGTFTVSKVGRAELNSFYDQWLGCEIRNKKYGIVGWQGIVWQLDLVQDGITYRRTLNSRVTHNNIMVKYSDAVGERQTDAFDENTDSSDEYGEIQFIYNLAGSTAAAAAALQARAKTQHSWPASREIGSLTTGPDLEPPPDDILHVTCAGFWATMNWKHRVTSETEGASTLITTLVGETEFVTAGRIETNALSVKADADPIPQRLGDLIGNITSQGDASGNIWNCGVYQDRELVYEQTPTTVDYYIRGGALVDTAGGLVIPELIEPGFYLKNANAPIAGQPPGASNLWDDPQVAYCDEVEYIWPDLLRLHISGEKPGTYITLQQIRHGTAV